MKTKSFTKIDTILLVTSNYIPLVVACQLSNQNRFDYRILHDFTWFLKHEVCFNDIHQAGLRDQGLM